MKINNAIVRITCICLVINFFSYCKKENTPPNANLKVFPTFGDSIVVLYLMLLCIY